MILPSCLRNRSSTPAGSTPRRRPEGERPPPAQTLRGSGHASSGYPFFPIRPQSLFGRRFFASMPFAQRPCFMICDLVTGKMLKVIVYDVVPAIGWGSPYIVHFLCESRVDQILVRKPNLPCQGAVFHGPHSFLPLPFPAPVPSGTMGGGEFRVRPGHYRYYIAEEAAEGLLLGDPCRSLTYAL